jgi:predicted XRE-type DNA-binding protein
MATGAHRAKTRRVSKKPRKTPVEHGSGNVFADLGLPNAPELLAKAELARRIVDLIRQQKLTQSQAATRLGVDQPKISALVRGNLEGFSSDRLFRFLNALGRDVEIVIRRASRDQRPRTTIVSTS